ncbi:MAG TPA: alanine--tRNA ligase [Acidimicrobiales bacterium]|nr:alanine--tRNA ligase [Acidimicrobiales bacterium]
MDANELRAAFTGYFAEHGHVVVPSASLIPHHPRAPLFTNAGMNQFISYYLQEEVPPYRRATSVQKCVRIRGKHDDIELIGRTTRHLSFFEMLGNFSFGDYFKKDAIGFAWELLTARLGFDGDRLWVTVHVDDDESFGVWRDMGVPEGRIQRMGEENFWEMGDTGPCGPDSEIFYDRGPEWGHDGGPAGGDEERFPEIWNLVFPQFDRQPDGSLPPLPKPGIDTGAGLERMLAVLNGVPSIWETDVLRPVIAAAEGLTGRRYGDDAETDVALRVMADHGRSVTMLVSDGVLPSNEGRGYVLRRLIRRAVLTARRLGTEQQVAPRLAAATAEVMGQSYPKVLEDLDLVSSVLGREEAGFDRTLRTGLGLLEEALAEPAEGQAGGGGSARVLPGEVAFRLHDTHGFPIELTEELAGEQGVTVDRTGFEAAMAEQRARAREAARSPAAADEDAYRRILEEAGPTTFVGQSPEHYSVATQVVGVLAGTEPGTAEIFLDRTPFYAEGGGQVGDVGTIVTETGRAEVVDTVAALPGLSAHRARVDGELLVGQDAVATIDGDRREALRRNHTATHLLHAALRQVLGDHVRQQGSLVAPDRLRFDYSHHEAPTPDQLAEVLELANAEVLSDAPVEVTETSRAEAEQMGAIAFFGDKYGDVVRVIQAGPHSLEFCGGTHVRALGQIGPIAIVSEGSIGANTRRLEAVTGFTALHRAEARDALVGEAAALLRAEPDELVDAVQRLLERQRAADKELQSLRAAATDALAATLAEGAEGGVVVARQDGHTAEELRSLAQAVRRRPGVRAAVLGGSADGSKVAIAVATGGDPDAGALVKQVGKIVQGGGGGSPEVAVAGGRDLSRLDDALGEARRLLSDR